MALRCLMALRNSESRSGCRKAEPALMQVGAQAQQVRHERLAAAARSTPGFDWNSLRAASCRSSSFSTSERTSPRVVMARMSMRLAHRGAAAPLAAPSRCDRAPGCRGNPGAGRCASARSAAARKPAIAAVGRRVAALRPADASVSVIVLLCLTRACARKRHARAARASAALGRACARARDSARAAPQPGRAPRSCRRRS